jgi:hypothetical protein
MTVCGGCHPERSEGSWASMNRFTLPTVGAASSRDGGGDTRQQAQSRRLFRWAFPQSSTLNLAPNATLAVGATPCGCPRRRPWGWESPGGPNEKGFSFERVIAAGTAALRVSHCDPTPQAPIPTNPGGRPWLGSWSSSTVNSGSGCKDAPLWDCRLACRPRARTDPTPRSRHGSHP